MFSRLTQVASDVVGEGARQLRSADVAPPPERSPLGEFLHAFALPFVIRARLLRDPKLRRRYWKITATQAAVTLTVALLVVAAGDDWRMSSASDLRAEAAELREKAARVRARPAEVDADELRDVEDDERDARDAERDAEGEGRLPRIKVEWDTESGPKPAGAPAESAPRPAEPAPVEAPPGQDATLPPGASSDGKRTLEEAITALTAQGLRQAAEAYGEQAERAKERGEERGAKPEEVETALRSIAAEALAEAERSRDRASGRLRGNSEWLAGVYEKRAAEREQEALEREERGVLQWLDRGLLFWAALVSALWTVQLLVIWLSRDHHDYLSRHASLAVGIEPEDPEAEPRVRVNVKWLITRMRRRWRGFKAFGVGLAIVYPLSWVLPGGNVTETALSSAWFAYWWLVFSAAKSARAWTEPVRPPWFLRGWNRFADHAPVVSGPMRVYSRLLHRFTHELHPPAIVVEKQPYAMAGLGLARAIGSLPVIEPFLRPFFPVASAVLIEDRRRREHPAGPDVVVPAQPLPDAAIREGSAWRGP